MSGPHLFFGFWGEWELNQKVMFDGPTKTIVISPSVDVIDIGVDLYSAWKDWALLRDNLKFLQAMRSTGGDPLPGNLKLGATYFLVNGWRILLDHGVSFLGNMYTEEGDSPFIVADGVQLGSTTVSNLVDRASAELTSSQMAAAVWAALKIAYTAPGSFGEALAAIQAAAEAVDARLPADPAQASEVTKVRKIVTPGQSLL